MNELKTEKTMSVKEVSEVLGYDESHIRKIGKELFPQIFENGKKTNLSESHVTAIKLNLGKNSELPKTNLEKMLLIKQAEQYRDEMILELQKEVELLKPKAIEYDTFMSTEGYQTFGEIAKVLGVGRNIMLAILRNNGILLANNTPYQKHMNKGFKVVERIQHGIKLVQTVCNSDALEYIKSVLNRSKIEAITN